MLEVEAMSRTVSPSSKKPYGVARVAGLWGLARSSFYAARHRKRHPREEQKRGPKVLSDAELVTAIRQLLHEAVFSGETIARFGPGFGIRASGPRRTAYCSCCGKTSCSRQPGHRSQFGAIRTRDDHRRTAQSDVGNRRYGNFYGSGGYGDRLRRH